MSGNKDKPADNNEKLFSRSRLFFIIFSALLIVFVVYYFPEIRKEIRMLKKVNIYWLIAAIVSQFFTYFFTAVIYRFLLAAHKIKQAPGLWDLLKASLVSLFFSQTVPSAGVSGNTFIFNFLSKSKIKVTQIISVILAELLTFYAAMQVIIITLLLVCLFLFKVRHIIVVTLAIGFAVYLVFAASIAFAGRKKFIDLIFKKIQKVKFIKKIFEKLTQKIEQQGISNEDVNVLALLEKNKGQAMKVFLFHLLVITADAFTLYALFSGLGIPVSPFVVLLGLISTRIVSLIPFLPGSLILYESSMTFFFTTFALPFGAAAIVTLIYRLLSFWFPIPVGLFLYKEWQQKTSDN
ncbi:MAG TPA: lysylphosphatidylglycerol synthase transmembrane domain-containing protein [Chitinophagaceae bacterium]|jgi:hypothetical protein|nr:lysylphosphatidylglycerol synthase transmembrane domain-containing protein [Chitinophagaceae bacterium]